VRRCRHPVAVRAVVEDGRPIRITTDRRRFAGGPVLSASGPWRTSGSWWNASRSEVSSLKSQVQTSDFKLQTSDLRLQTSDLYWNRDEWDAALGDGAVYRIFRDRETDGWFIDAVFD